MRKSKWRELFGDIEHGKRLIEFIGLCLIHENDRLRYEDIAKELKVDIVSVHRYRTQLNCLGITVHSYKKTGVKLSVDVLSSDIWLVLAQLYQSYTLIDESIVKAEKTIESGSLFIKEASGLCSEMNNLKNAVNNRSIRK